MGEVSSSHLGNYRGYQLSFHLCFDRSALWDVEIRGEPSRGLSRTHDGTIGGDDDRGRNVSYMRHFWKGFDKTGWILAKRLIHPVCVTTL